MAVQAHADGFGIALFLFGCFFPVAAYLIIRSGYIPRTIGFLYLIPGASYISSSLALILAPDFAGRYYFAMAGPAVIGELSLALWLLVKGVDVSKWKPRAAPG